MNGGSRSRRIRALGILLAGLAAAAGSYLLGTYPVVGELRREIDSAERQLARGQQRLSEARAARKNLSQFREGRLRLERALLELSDVEAWSPDADSDGLIARIERLSRDRRLVVDAVAHESLALQADDRFRRLAIDLELRGAFSDLTRFCGSLDDEFRSASIQHVELETLEGRGPSARMRARLTVSIIYGEDPEAR